MRRVAKTVNFGVIYGLSAFGLAGRLGISQAEAAAFIEAYFQEYAGVDAFITRTLETAQAAGRVETILGRRRPINGIKNTTGRNRNLAERTAINTVIQGSAADLIKMAMIRSTGGSATKVSRPGCSSRSTTSWSSRRPTGEIAGLAALVRHEMTTALDLKVPLKVDLAAGHQLARRRGHRGIEAAAISAGPCRMLLVSWSCGSATGFSMQIGGNPLQAVAAWRIR